tara:strand:- start:2856 stop:3080 length:225 start_codon:yes stop_codon:yes gene_type:complete
MAKHKKMTPNGIVEEEMTQAEIDALAAENQQADESSTQAEQKEQERKDLKASAKAKLIAGEPLTEAEADTLVLN